MKTIGFVIPRLFIGGVETVMGNTIDAMMQYTDYKIIVFTHSPIFEPYWQKFFADRPNVKLYSILPLNEKFEYFKGKLCFPFENIRKIIFSIYKKYRLLRMRYGSTMRSCDVIIDYFSGLSARRVRKLKQPKITWLHCSIKCALENNIVKSVSIFDKIVCISDTMKFGFAENFPQYANKLVRIYNPVDYKSIRAISTNSPSFDGKYFLCVGRLDHDKDTPTIIRAFDDFWIRENKPDVKMVFIGDGDTAAKMKKMASETKAADHFVFLGKITKPYGYMRDAIAHILSSFSEGLPTVLIESMATETLNISSDCPSGPHEILLDGVAGILFKPGDHKQLSQILSDVYHNNVDAAGMISCATKSLKRFDPKTVSQQIVDLVADVINQQNNKHHKKNTK